MNRTENKRKYKLVARELYIVTRAMTCSIEWDVPYSVLFTRQFWDLAKKFKHKRKVILQETFETRHDDTRIEIYLFCFSNLRALIDDLPLFANDPQPFVKAVIDCDDFDIILDFVRAQKEEIPDFYYTEDITLNYNSKKLKQILAWPNVSWSFAPGSTRATITDNVSKLKLTVELDEYIVSLLQYVINRNLSFNDHTLDLRKYDINSDVITRLLQVYLSVSDTSFDIVDNKTIVVRSPSIKLKMILPYDALEKIISVLTG